MTFPNAKPRSVWLEIKAVGDKLIKVRVFRIDGAEPGRDITRTIDLDAPDIRPLDALVMVLESIEAEMGGRFESQDTVYAANRYRTVCESLGCQFKAVKGRRPA